MTNSSDARIAILCWEEGHVPKGLVQLESLVGNSTNLDSYPFPVRLCRIRGANLQTVLESPSREVLQRMIETSQELVSEGIQAITTSCGFNAVFQRELAEAVDVPVFTSSLLQIPFVTNLLAPEKAISVITAKKTSLKKEHFEAAGIMPTMNVEVFGMEESPEWNKIFTAPDEPIDLGIVEKDVVETARSAVKKRPDTGAVVLECTDLPPFAQAIRDTTGLPVFDFVTMMGFVARSLGIVSAY
ncbi:MAG: aspartate/glutamate racemase family protein [Thermovirgaceae bacterium]